MELYDPGTFREVDGVGQVRLEARKRNRRRRVLFVGMLIPFQFEACLSPSQLCQDGY